MQGTYKYMLMYGSFANRKYLIALHLMMKKHSNESQLKIWSRAS